MNNQQGNATTEQQSKPGPQSTFATSEKTQICFEAIETLAETHNEINEENLLYLVAQMGLTADDVHCYLT